jgi:hypothetical protein
VGPYFIALKFGVEATIEFDPNLGVSGSFYFVQYKKTKTDIIEYQSLNGDWGLDDPSSDPRKPNGYRVQEPVLNGNVVMTDSPGLPVPNDTAAVLVPGDARRRGYYFEHQPVGDAYLKLLRVLGKNKVSFDTQIETYLVQIQQQNGKRLVTPLGYIKWGFKVEGSKLGFETTPTEAQWEKGPDPLVWQHVNGRRAVVN